MANSNTAAFAPEFSLGRQADTNNGLPVVYPQKNINVRIGQVIGRIYFPKGHASRTASWFFDKIQVIYDSWKSNGWSGWTHAGNPVRVVKFILKPGVDLNLWFDIAKSFVDSNLRYVQDRTNLILEKLAKHLRSIGARITTATKETATKIADTVVQTVAPHTTTPQVEIVEPVVASPQPSAPVVTPQSPVIPTPVLRTERLFSEKDYAFVLKYKPKSLKRVCKALGFECVDPATLAEDLLCEQVDPKEVKAVFTRKKKQA